MIFFFKSIFLEKRFLKKGFFFKGSLENKYVGKKDFRKKKKLGEVIFIFIFLKGDFGKNIIKIL